MKNERNQLIEPEENFQNKPLLAEKRNRGLNPDESDPENVMKMEFYLIVVISLFLIFLFLLLVVLIYFCRHSCLRKVGNSEQSLSDYN
jgi:hypothetical protein